MGILSNFLIAVTGTLPADTSQLKKWIEANDGRYSPHVRKGVTHLVTGKDAWKNATDSVQIAVKIGAFVVSYDWLEDSLLKRRKLAETKYTWEHLWQERKRSRQMKKLGSLVDAKKFNEGCEGAKKATGTGTSKSRTSARKPKASKSFFFADVVNVPFVSAADDLKRRREEREVAKAKKIEATTAKEVENERKEQNEQATTRAPSTARSVTSNIENLASPSSGTSQTLSATSFHTASSHIEAQAKKLSLKDLYHFYLDTTGFEYKIVLTRCNLRANEITRYRLSILESHTKPHVYCTFAEYIPPGVSAPSVGETACIQALMDYNATFAETTAGDPEPVNTSNSQPKDLRSTSPQTNASPPHQSPDPIPQATHLRTLLSSLTPSPSTPYKSLIAPVQSSFPTAWRTFRHAFRDLTLLSWEERFDLSKSLYKARAAHFGIEPYIYLRPKTGLPLGLRTQLPGLFQGQTLVRGERTEAGGVGGRVEAGVRANDDGYVFNAFSLPSLAHPLGEGVVGAAVRADAEARRKAVLLEEERAREVEEQRVRREGLGSRVWKGAKREGHKGPLFNGVMGRPVRGPREGARGASVGAGVGRRRLFPSERE